MKILIIIFVSFFSSQVFSQDIKLFCLAKVHGTSDYGWIDYNDRISTLEINLENNQIVLEWKVSDYYFSDLFDIISNYEGKIRAIEDSGIDVPGMTSIAINLDKKIFVYTTSTAEDEHEHTIWSGTCN